MYQEIWVESGPGMSRAFNVVKGYPLSITHMPRTARISSPCRRIRQFLPWNLNDAHTEPPNFPEFTRISACAPTLAQDLFYYRVTLSGTDWSSPLWR